jgi:hypothetical protein
MKAENKDLPAYPIVNSDGYCSDHEIVTGKTCGAIGLTKREYFAAMAMQGLCVTRYTNDDLDIEKLAKKAVIIAAQTLNQLEK